MDVLRCAHCSDVVGAYEPIYVLLTDGTNRHGSSLTLKDQLAIPETVAVHDSCWPAFNRLQARQRPA